MNKALLMMIFAICVTLVACKGAGTGEAPQGKVTQGAAYRGTIGIYGKVKNIVGNSVTISIAERPKKSSAGSENGNANGSAGSPDENIPEGSAPPIGEPRPEGSGGGPPSDGMPGSPFGGLSSSDLKYTGEVEEMMIPVGVEVSMIGSGGLKSVDIGDINKGDIITVFYAEGTKDIERVMIRQGD